MNRIIPAEKNPPLTPPGRGYCAQAQLFEDALLKERVLYAREQEDNCSCKHPLLGGAKLRNTNL
jgi:hypothetical protein